MTINIQITNFPEDAWEKFRKDFAQSCFDEDGLVVNIQPDMKLDYFESFREGILETISAAVSTSIMPA